MFGSRFRGLMFPTLVAVAACGDNPAEPGADATGTVSGLVTAANGTTPIPAATVTVRATDGGGESRPSSAGASDLPSTITDVDGRYVLDGVPVGARTLDVRKGVFVAELKVNVVADQEVEAAAALLEPEGDLGYVAGLFDSIEDIVGDLLNNPIEEIDATDLGSAAVLTEYRMIFINCGSDATLLALTDEIDAGPIREWVEDGGVLYVSDLDLDFLSYVFPEFISDQGDGDEGATEANVVSTGLREFLGGKSSVQIVYDLPSWLHPTEISGDVDVLISGPYPGGGASEGNLAIAFRFGAGKVVFTSFHNDAAATEDQRAVLTSYVYGGYEETASASTARLPNAAWAGMHEAHEAHRAHVQAARASRPARLR